MSIEADIEKIAQNARQAAKEMARCETARKNDVLMAIADHLSDRAEAIKQENLKDLAYGREKGLTSAMMDRLTISDATIASMVKGLHEVAQLPDPVGTMGPSQLRPNGLQVTRMRIPLGVIGIIYESRPNVTIDAAALCLKAGNSVILRGGSEALNSNRILAAAINDALTEAGLPAAAAQVVGVRDREAVTALLAQEEYVDLIIPRGGEGLIRFVVANSKIPVLKHYKGVCHVYVDQYADLQMAAEICFNAKVQRPGVCNSMETMLVHKAVAERFLPAMAEQLTAAGVTIKGCPETVRILPVAQEATESDWPAEFLDLTLAVKVVDDMDAAMDHIARYGSQHTEAIVSDNYARGRRFVREVDASAVMINASTRFNDGGELGLGAEIGISTSKLHAFGPMGVDELTTTKFVVLGDGQLRK